MFKLVWDISITFLPFAREGSARDCLQELTIDLLRV
jgi:hypothetical protein